MVLECKDLRREYRRGAETIKALDGVDLSLDAGELVALVGPSGSGKTTLMNLVGLLDRPTAGELVLAGRRVDGLSRRQRVRERRRRIGFVFQNFYLLPELRAWENVALPMLFDRRPGRSARARELLDRVGLGERKHHLPSELSGGEMQRVAIARALANEPPLILADEPTGKLDTANGERIAALLQDLAAGGVSVLIATHDMDLAATADRIITLKDGRVHSG